jgi:hypothetical protein
MSYDILQCSITSNKFQITWSLSHKENELPSIENLTDRFIDIYGLSTMESLINYTSTNETIIYIIFSDEYGNIHSVEFDPLSDLEIDTSFVKLIDKMSQCLNEFFYFKKIKDEEEPN